MIGFVILSHRSEAQLRQLIHALNRIYDRPPVACHHDLHQAPADLSRFPTNVRFVEPPIRTGWGRWSVVEAGLRGIATLYAHSDPEWFVLLSAADFPVRAPELVLAELRTSGVDAFIDTRPIDDVTSARAAHWIGIPNPSLTHFGHDGVRAMKRRHYTGAELWLPRPRNDAGRLRLGRHTVHLPVDLPWAPFDAAFACFYGDHWFTANRRVANLLLAPSRNHLRLQRHLATRPSADECYYQSVICNDPGLIVQRNNKRFAEWNGGGAHPRELGWHDWPAMAKSGAHFARKFIEGDPVLSQIEARLLTSRAVA